MERTEDGFFVEVSNSTGTDFLKLFTVDVNVPKQIAGYMETYLGPLRRLNFPRVSFPISINIFNSSKVSWSSKNTVPRHRIYLRKEVIFVSKGTSYPYTRVESKNAGTSKTNFPFKE